MKTVTTTNTIEKKLLYCNTENEAQIMAAVDRTMTVLNDLYSVWKFDHIHQIPQDAEQWAFNMAIASDEKLKALDSSIKLDASQVKIPTSIRAISSRMSAYNANKGLYLPYLQYTRKTANGFELDNAKLEQELSRNRRYAETPEQIARLNFAVNYVKFIKEEVKVDNNARSNWTIPCTSWNRSVGEIYPGVNIHWVLNGGPF